MENAFALGLTGFSLTAILGLVPMALDGVHEAGERQARADIVRQLHALARRTPLPRLPSICHPQCEFFYDTEGVAVAGSQDAAYHAWLEPAAGRAGADVVVLNVVIQGGKERGRPVPLYLADHRGARAP